MPVDEKMREPPEWLNKEYLTNALREGLKQPSLQINSFAIKPATATGDNYQSLMFRAELKITKNPPAKTPEETLSVVVKTQPPDVTMKDMMKNFKITIFQRETRMLRDVLPAMNKLLRNAEPLSADFIWFGDKPEEVIILQDLKQQGFGNLDRMNGFDLDSSKVALKALAQFHASSLAILQTQPDILENLTDNLWIDPTDDTMPIMLKQGIANLLEEAAEWADFPAEQLQKLKELAPNIIEKYKDSLKYEESALNVLQHGDFWINNMMFNVDGGKPNRIRLVDFQVTCLNSAAMDLNYFIFTSPNFSIRLEKIEEMLEAYYKSFMETINKLEVKLTKPFNFEDLMEEFKRRAFIGFFSTIIIYPITITETKDVLSGDDFLDEGTSKKAQYQNQTFQRVFKMVLPYFIDCGVI